jgi:release factor glutamine methyltransferase
MSAPNDPTWNVLRLLQWTQGYLARAGWDEPRLAAEVLLAHVLDCERIQLYARFDTCPNPAQLEAYRHLVRRAAASEPVAYLVGHKEFYSLRFEVTPDVLIPRPETEALVAEAIGHLKALGRPGRVWDACTGSGCVAVALAAQAPDAVVLATDISPAAVKLTERNAARHGVHDRVLARQGDLLALPPDAADLSPFDLVVANPPYVAEGDEVADVVRHEPAEALYAGPDGLACIRPLIAEAGDFLRPGGLLILEFGRGQADAVRDLIVATGRFAEPRILTDHQGIERTAAAALLAGAARLDDAPHPAPRRGQVDSHTPPA